MSSLMVYHKVSTLIFIHVKNISSILKTNFLPSPNYSTLRLKNNLYHDFNGNLLLVFLDGFTIPVYIFKELSLTWPFANFTWTHTGCGGFFFFCKGEWGSGFFHWNIVRFMCIIAFSYSSFISLPYFIIWLLKGIFVISNLRQLHIVLVWLFFYIYCFLVHVFKYFSWVYTWVNSLSHNVCVWFTLVGNADRKSVV